jgi:hypothetical protein
VAKLFSLTWIVENDSNQLKYVGYCSLFEKLKRRKGSATHAPSRAVRDAYASRAFSRGKNRVTCDLRRAACAWREEITAPLLLYRVNVLPFLRIESTQLKRCIKYRCY